MSTCTIRVLLIVGAMLELAGIALVAWDVWHARRTLKDMSRPDWVHEQTQQEKQRSLPALMAEVAAGNLWLRGIGVALFACGLLVQTIANVYAL